MKKFNINQLKEINRQLNNKEEESKLSQRDKIEMEKFGVIF